MYVQRTKFYCPKCHTHDHWGDEACPKEVGVSVPSVEVRPKPEKIREASGKVGVARKDPIGQAKEFLRKVGRPRLNRSPEEKRRMRSQYIRKYRDSKRKKVLGDGGGTSKLDSGSE